MTYKLLAIATMSLSLGSTSVLAQAAQTGTVGQGMQYDTMPMEWEGDIEDAFYSDPDLAILRDEEEMRENWDDLDDEDRDTVRDFCERFDMDDRAMLERDAEMGTDTTPGVGTDTTPGVDPGTTPGAETMPSPGMGLHHASFRQICDMVEEYDEDNDNND